jgi:hypothetical protein
MPSAYSMEQTDPHSGVANAALILGILSLVSFFIWCCCAPLGIAGIVTGTLGLGSITHKTMATVGLVLSVIGIVPTIALTVAGVYLINSGSMLGLAATHRMGTRVHSIRCMACAILH